MAGCMYYGVSPGGHSMTLLQQIEFYFSVDNLCRDVYLRLQMDADGSSPTAWRDTTAYSPAGHYCIRPGGSLMHGLAGHECTWPGGSPMHMAWQVTNAHGLAGH